ncbi:MAG: hypothetical protein ABFS12_18570, partial [Bacteroidota bacterium]
GEEKMYLINNVSVGLKWALEHKKVKANKIAFQKLSELYKEVCELKHPFRYEDINYSDLTTALEISYESLEVINEL